MNLLESLKKRFFSDNESLDSSLVDPTRVVGSTSDDWDMTSFIHPSLIPQQLKTKTLSTIENINGYRKLANSADGAVYIDEVINEIYSPDKEQLPKIKIDSYDIPVGLEKKLQEGFEKILNLIDFRRSGTDLIRQWYVDGHLFLECVFDNGDLKSGIKQILILDPKGMVKEFNDALKREIYKYNITSGVGTFGAYFGKEYEKEQLVHVWSELKDENDNAIGYLHSALKPSNQMRIIEDMIVVYRITRGGEKRAIKVNVGGMPKAKAISYMSELVNKFRNKRTYNTELGTVDNNAHIMALTEDLWLPTKNDTKDIDITTLAGGMQLGEMDDVNYFRNKMLTALRIPSSRFKEDSMSFDISATEVNAQEKRFSKYVGSLRLKFNQVFVELLKRELVSTKAMNEEEFNSMKAHIRFIYPDEASVAKREYYSVLEKKLNAISSIDTYVGKYFTEDYIHREILDRNDEDIVEFKDQLTKEQEAKIASIGDSAGMDDLAAELNGGEEPEAAPAAEPTPAARVTAAPAAPEPKLPVEKPIEPKEEKGKDGK